MVPPAGIALVEAVTLHRRQPQATIRAIAYLRVRPGAHAESELSLEHQRTKCEALAARYALDLVDTIADADVTRTLRRPGLARLLELVRTRQTQVLLIAKLDRLSRSLLELSSLVSLCDAHGVTLLSAAESLDTSSAGGPMVVKLLSVLSAWERETIGQRTKEALRAKRNRGQIYGSIPYGLQLAADGVTLEPCLAERRMIDAAVSARRQGETWRAIVYALNQAGYRNRAGRPWILTNLRAAVLTAERHATERRVGQRGFS